jgi:hypothetical protein
MMGWCCGERLASGFVFDNSVVGCWWFVVELLGDPYTNGIPLPRIPNNHAPVRDSRMPRTDVAAAMTDRNSARVPRVSLPISIAYLKYALRRYTLRSI